MARETDYTVVYRAAADFSALAREAAKAKAILKAMREEEEKANKVSLKDQDALEKARVRARKALEAQNMAATTSARISREMAERGKREAETVKELARNSEVAARQINKLAEAYKKLNGASSGETTSNASRNITGNTSFAAVTSRELEKVQKNLASYMASARSTTDTNTRLDNSMKNIKSTTSQYSDLLARLSNAQRDASRGTTIITQETKKFGDVVETTTRKVHNAGTESERVETTIRRVTKATEQSGTAFQRWAGSVAANLRRAWKEADDGVSVFGKLRNAMSNDSSTSGYTKFLNTMRNIREQATHTIASIVHLPRAFQVAIGIAAIFEPAVAVLGSLGAAALGAANNIAFLAGSLAAIPGLIAAAGTGLAALIVATKPVVGVLQQYAKAQQEIADNASKAAPKQRDNADAIRSAARGVRSATESLADAQRAEKRAQEDLTRAWDDAKRSLQDLRDEVARGSLDEEAAVIRLARAQEEQARTNKDIKASALDRREAALGVKEAEADLAEVRRRNKENAAELAEVEKKGLANSEQVVRAQENLANAHRGVRNASLNLADAKAQLASASKVEVAQATQTHTQQARYQKMLDELGPKTRKFTEYIVGLKDEWKKIQRDTSEAFFKNIAGDTQKLNSLLPITSNLLTTASDALGRVAHRGIEMLASGPWKADFKQLAKDNAVNIENMGDAGLSVADAFRHITMAAAPFTKWVTSAIKEGAANFAAWAKRAREDHSIQRFLDEAKERMQAMWRIAKNVGATLASWNTATNDFGKWMLQRLELMTKRWRDNAKAQEESGSRLRKYLEDVKPVLTAVGALIGALVKGFADIASDPENIQSTVKLLTALQRDVLPPLLRFLDELNDSGIALTVAHALSTIFDALSDFLEGGGGQAISTFVNVFADVVDLIAELYGMPGIGQILGYIAIGYAAVAAATVAAKFAGLFRLMSVFRWIAGSGKSVISNLRGIGDAAAEAGQKTTTVTKSFDQPQPGSGSSRPSGPVSTTTGFRVISNSELAAVKKNVDEYSKAAQGAAEKSGFFARSLDGVKNAAGRVRGGLGSFVDFLGGPWGAALAVATVAVSVFLSEQDKIKGRVEEYKAALDSAAGSYDGVARGAQNLTAESINANPKLAEMIRLMKEAGFSAEEIRSSFEGAGEGVENASAKIDKSIEDLRNKLGLSNLDIPGVGKEKPGFLDKMFNGDDVDKLEKLEALKKALDENKLSAEDAAAAIEILGIKQDKAAESTKSYTEKTQAANFAQAAAGERANAYGEILDVLSDTSATTAQRFEALKRATELMYGDQINATEASENFNRRLLELRDTLKQNGDTLSEHSLAGLNNRDALEAAAGAVKDETLQLIASGVPYEEAIKKHKERTDKLKAEYKGSKDNKKAAAELIDQYAKIPEGVKTNVELTGFPAVYENLRALQFSQYALKHGMSPDEAAASWNRAQAAAKGQYPQGSGSAGLKPNTKRAGGGPVWGEGTKTSDSIAAWLSNGEWVHKAASVDYYGHSLMSALNNMEIKKETLDTAMALSRGVGQKDKLDPMFSLGGAVLRLAQGGFVRPSRIDQVSRINQTDSIARPSATWPMDMSLTGVTAAARKLYDEWKKNYVSGGDGGSVGVGGLRSGILNILADLRAHFGKVGLISGLRPGSKTLSGNTSYHASGRAIDIAPVRAWAEYLKEHFGGVLKELITPWRDINMLHGRPHRYSRAIEAQHGVFGNNAHIHAAYANGGLVQDLNNLYSFGGLATPAMAGVAPSNVSGLSQAARSVVNNSGMNFGDIIINNPVPERGGDSIRSSVLRTAMLFDGP